MHLSLRLALGSPIGRTGGARVPAWVGPYDFRFQFDNDRYWDGETEYSGYAALTEAGKVAFARADAELAYDGDTLRRFGVNVPRLIADGIWNQASGTQYVSPANADALAISGFTFDTAMASVVDAPDLLAASGLAEAVPQGKVYRFAATGGGTKYLGMNVSSILPASNKVRAIYARKVGSGVANWAVGSTAGTAAIPASDTLQFVALYDSTSINTSELAVASGTTVEFVLMNVQVQTGTQRPNPIVGGSRGAETLTCFWAQGDYDVEVVRSDDSVIEYDAQSIGSSGYIVPRQPLPIREVRGTAISPL